MKKIFSRGLSFLIILTLMMAMLTACSSGSVQSSVLKDSADRFESSDYITNGGAGIYDDYEYGSESDADYSDKTESVDSARKIIERISMTVETKGFDDLLNVIEQRVREVNGYTESSNIYGNSYYSTGNRSARIVLRIPSDKSDEFVDFVTGNGVVTRKTIDTEDVTLQYVDVESRLSALELEKASLEKLLAEANDISDIITVQDRLTDVIYEIESANSQLRTFDNLIDYTTITLSIEEVETPTVVHEQTVWEKIATKFTKNVKEIKDDIVDLFVEVVGGSPYLLIYAVIIFVIVIIIKKISKKQAAIKAATMDATTSRADIEQPVDIDSVDQNIDQNNK